MNTIGSQGLPVHSFIFNNNLLVGLMLFTVGHMNIDIVLSEQVQKILGILQLTNSLSIHHKVLLAYNTLGLLEALYMK